MVFIDFSVVVPVYNEEESIGALFEEICQAMNGMKGPYEIVFVNDCSSDKSYGVMKELQGKFPNIVNIVHLTQRSGQTYAMKQGLNAVRGEIAVTLDADLQNGGQRL